MGYLSKVVLPGNQVININKYELGLIESSYIETNDANSFFKLLLDDYPGTEVYISRFNKIDKGVDGYQIVITVNNDNFIELLDNIEIYEDESDDIDLCTNNLKENYLLLKSLDNQSDKYVINMYNCDITIFSESREYYIEDDIEKYGDDAPSYVDTVHEIDIIISEFLPE